MATALLEKQLKSRMSIAADHFNRATSKGLDYFQVFVHPINGTESAFQLQMSCADFVSADIHWGSQGVH